MTKSRILVIHYGALGDVVATFPALLRLKAVNGPMSMVCQGNIGSLARHLDIIDKWFPLEAAAFASLHSSHVDPFVKKILCSYPKIILFSRSPSLESTLFSITRNDIYCIHPRPDSDQKIYVARHVLSNLSRFGLLEASEEDMFYKYYSTIHEDRRDPDYNTSKIFIHPGSGSRKKCWPISNFIKIAKSIDSDGKQPEFIIGPAEYDLSQILIQQNTPSAKVHIIETLTELAGLLKTGGGFIGNDSGVSHLSAFIGLPTVAVFGPSDPNVWKPKGRAVDIVWQNLECSPCFETGPVGCEEIECFNKISVEDVLTAFYGLVS